MTGKCTLTFNEDEAKNIIADWFFEKYGVEIDVTKVKFDCTYTSSNYSTKLKQVEITTNIDQLVEKKNKEPVKSTIEF